MPETISFYPGRKEALASKSGTHISAEYDILEDSEQESGERVIRLKKKDLTEETKNRKELVVLLCGKLKESTEGLFAKLLEDTLLDYRRSDVDSMIRDIKKGKSVSKAPTHCFRLHIGDGRKKRSHTLSLRD